MHTKEKNIQKKTNKMKRKWKEKGRRHRSSQFVSRLYKMSLTSPVKKSQAVSSRCKRKLVQEIEALE
jgi:hypothetical protein